MEESGLEKRQVQIRWPVESGHAVFANNVTVQADSGGMTYITFFQAIPPVLMGPDIEAQIASLESIEAKPVIKIAVTQNHLKKIIETLQNYAGE